MSENPEEIPMQSTENMICIPMKQGILEITTDDKLTLETAIFIIEAAKIKVMQLAGVLTQTNKN